MQFRLEPVTEKEAIWTMHFLNAPSQTVISGDSVELLNKQVLRVPFWELPVPEEGRPNRTMTQAHTSKSAPKQPPNPGKGEGNRKEKGGNVKAGRQEPRVRRRKGERWP